MEKTINFTIPAELDGKSVGYIISNRFKLSRAIVAKLKNYEKGIMLNGRRVKANEAVCTGDVLTLNMQEEKITEVIPNNIPIDILYEDEEIIVVNKPPHMPTHPSKNCKTGTLANALMYYFKEASFVFRVITRLDKDTSGVVLIAKNHFSAQKLNEEMKSGNIKKEYVAVVNGVLQKNEGEINLPIKKTEGIKREVGAEGKSAHTIYFTEKSFDNVSLVRLFPITGRTHQLRVHLSYIGHPIYGDTLYGAQQTGERQRLHCRKIEFNHPVSGKTEEIEAPVPDDILKLCCNKDENNI